MRVMGWAGIAAALLLAATPSRAHLEPAPACRPVGIGADSFCQVDGVRLHLVDWGGEGPPLILLAGFGATARTFDDLAPRLTGQRHVYAFTRRGFGLSGQTPGAYTAARFDKDLLGLMDGLGLARADLAGHSAAGAEMARFAAAHPDRVRRLVYLDAAYDFGDAMRLQGSDPLDRRPPPEALKGRDAYARYRAEVLGVDAAAVAADVRQTLRLQDGRLVPVTPPAQMAAIAGALLAGTPDYAAISAPSLAIYAPKDQLEQAPPGAPAAERAASLRYGLRQIRPWMLRDQARFLETAPCGVALEKAGATHHFYLTDPEWTAAAILAFLDSEAPCDWRGLP